MTARILVSRNKREGNYSGVAVRKWRYFVSGPTGHMRAGGGPYKRLTLRDWSRR
jgi:hypothetical protein